MKRTIKNILSWAFIVNLFILSPSCNDFDELNEDPTKWTSVDPNNQLTYVQLLTWGDWAPCYTYFAYVSSFTQHLQGEWNATNYGGLYLKADNVSKLAWDRIYSYSLKNLVDILYQTEGGDASYDNIRSAARIMKVYNYMILTDLYGDIPYFEGAKGYSEDISSPAYDSQEVIYKDFLKELKEAEITLNENGGLLTGDIMYNGNIDKWKRLANSLRLRIAMRMVYADPELAKNEVSEVMRTSSGLFSGANDDALIEYLDINSWDGGEFRRNALAQSWRSRDTFPGQFLCSVFWNHLKDTNDPRLFRIARCYEDTPGAENDPFSRIDITEEMMSLRGWDLYQPCEPGWFWYDRWPSGYTSPLAGYRWQAKGCRPQLNNVFLKGNTPGVLMTYAEVQLLLAEAKSRWPELALNGTAEDYYSEGVTASMNFLLKYGVKAYETNEISGYLAANPFPEEQENRIKAVNEQLWILHFNNPPEAWANVRRSHYPALKPSGYYGAVTSQSQIIPTRLNYPLEESSYNKASQSVALEDMGGIDDWNARVWWDKK